MVCFYSHNTPILSNIVTITNDTKNTVAVDWEVWRMHDNDPEITENLLTHGHASLNPDESTYVDMTPYGDDRVERVIWSDIELTSGSGSCYYEVLAEEKYIPISVMHELGYCFYKQIPLYL